ncbi:putative ankyrin membrane protein [Desulfamplus magnetovallimortis]|uniref:Putative ankyrin membrane protein n=1 Tax=Desulfamplus magnetovallimortis TaxID=1246637 RepID=A0A1W1HDU9_9BACT|nr:rhomboid family intramembrane serine protease [Desulfamplus magnetovallimortis]SLM30667.1 putative ankyrin membrane protein [Desulfamplus magnetovallimortis]
MKNLEKTEIVPLPELNISLSGLEREKADLIALVLSSQGIEVFWEKQSEGLYDLIIDCAQYPQAEKALQKFYLENPFVDLTGEKNQLPPETSLPVITGQAKIVVLFVALALSVVHFSLIYHGNHNNVVMNYGASALYILQGQYYRIFTAMMLHSNLGHLAGNVVGLLVFGTPLCSIAGAFRGMLLIILSGATGNLVNAWMHRQAHLSIGASTAVMGAIGILTAWQVAGKIIITYKDELPVKTHGRSSATPEYGDIVSISTVKNRNDNHQLKIDIKPSALFPLAAGAAVAGMLSGGENTDISAHVFGFLCGVVIGLVYLIFKEFKFFKENS